MKRSGFAEAARFLSTLIVSAVLTSACWAQGEQYRNMVLSAPPATTPPGPNDVVAIIQGGVTKKIPVPSLGGTLGTTLNQIYVDGAFGDDTNNCLSAQTACKTINAAITVAGNYNASGSSQVINIAAGTYNETVFVGGSIRGGFESHNDQSMLSLAGAGSGVVTIKGDGASCGTIVAQNGAAVGLQGLRLTGNATACQSILFSQLGANINVFSDVVLGAASQQHVHAEGLSQVNFWASYKVDGNAVYHLAAAQGSLIVYPPITMTVTITNTALSGAWALADSGGVIYLGASPITYTGNISSGEPYGAQLNGTIVNFGGVSLPGQGYGEIRSGGRYIPAPAPCIGGSGGLCPAGGAPTGLGTGGQANVGGSTRSGAVTLTSGSGATATAGQVTVWFGDHQTFGNVGNAAPCVLGIGDGTGIWAPGSTIKITGQPLNPYGIQIGWLNGGVALSTGSTYFISYICQSDT